METRDSRADRRRWRWLPPLALAALALGGCASLSEKECRAGDWYSIGLRDGGNGRGEDYIAEHAAACQGVGVAPDRERWLAGRERGLASFCTARNGYRIGEVGGTYGEVCFAGGDIEFRRGYDLGLRMNRLRGRLDSLDNEMRSLEGQLGRKEDPPTDAQRDWLQRRLRELDYERGYLRRDIDEIEWQGRAL